VFRIQRIHVDRAMAINNAQAETVAALDERMIRVVDRRT